MYKLRSWSIRHHCKPNGKRENDVQFMLEKARE